MTEVSYPWEGTATGDAAEAPYSADMWSDLWSMLFHYDRTVQGVVPTNRSGFNGNLEVTGPGGAVVRVDTGIALVDGKVYTNSANVDNNVSGNAVYWLIGLTKDFAGQTVRVFARGTYASRAAALAALVQTDGTTWEIPLATVLTDAGGDVDTITDERNYVLRPRLVSEIVPCMGGYDNTAGAALLLLYMGGFTINKDDDSEAYGVWKVPESYYQNLKIYAVLQSVGAGDLYCRLVANAGPLPGDPTLLSAGAAIAAVTVGTDEEAILETSFSPDVEPGYFVELYFERDATNVADTTNDLIIFAGWLVEYEAFY